MELDPDLSEEHSPCEACYSFTDISCQREWRLLHKKNVIIKILISKCQRFSACASWFTKDQECCKIYWASGNRVLDTFSMIQYMTICCLCHVNIIILSAIWLELSNSRVAPSKVTKMLLRRPGLFLHKCEGLGMRLLPNVCCAIPGLCIWTVSSISIWSTLACSLTVKLEELYHL